MSDLVAPHLMMVPFNSAPALSEKNLSFQKYITGTDGAKIKQTISFLRN
jgi:hypothetical protein